MLDSVISGVSSRPLINGHFGPILSTLPKEVARRVCASKGEDVDEFSWNVKYLEWLRLEKLSLQKYSVYCIAATFYECYTVRSSHISGNSGGPLLDHLGRLIGIVVASAPNFGFAIPIDSVMSCAGKLLKLEKARRYYEDTLCYVEMGPTT